MVSEKRVYSSFLIDSTYSRNTTRNINIQIKNVNTSKISTSMEYQASILQRDWILPQLLPY